MWLRWEYASAVEATVMATKPTLKMMDCMIKD